MEASTPPNRKKPVATAADIMTRDLITFRPDEQIRTAIDQLLRYRISGAPVVGEGRRLLGTLSEGDCLRAISAGSYDGEPVKGEQLVSDLMNAAPLTITPSTDIYAITQTFVKNDVRRLPVVDDGRVVGQVSRRDVLKVICRM
ncbi:MAG: CBS domain-containing protein [Acidobacteria bacterium]|nr:CBS domain-containing protein [Acidobacteriota bacterium]